MHKIVYNFQLIYSPVNKTLYVRNQLIRCSMKIDTNIPSSSIGDFRFRTWIKSGFLGGDNTEIMRSEHRETVYETRGNFNMAIMRMADLPSSSTEILFKTCWNLILNGSSAGDKPLKLVIALDDMR